ncbi:MAG: DUF2207 domain-containing protein, partial [Eggerthellaceae bacterium]|nr:DUF2207 domain-containing protein [Eggerthellaceae bacterium]
MLAFAALLCSVMNPSLSFAEGYTSPERSITLSVDSNGDLEGNDQKAFVFDGETTSVTYAFEDLPEDAVVEITSVRLAQTNEDMELEGEWEGLPSVSFWSAWRDGGGPTKNCYSYDEADSTLYVYYDAFEGSMIIEVGYTVQYACDVYSDETELSWRFVPSTDDVDAENVSVTVRLPVPADYVDSIEDAVLAFSHGPEDGELSVNEDGTVSYYAPDVIAGQFAEIRILFPSSWLTNLPEDYPTYYPDTSRLDTVLSEEEGYVDVGNEQRQISVRVAIGLLAGCIIILLISIFLFMKYGK